MFASRMPEIFQLQEGFLYLHHPMECSVMLKNFPVCILTKWFYGKSLHLARSYFKLLLDVDTEKSLYVRVQQLIID
jgi:hypothetical protein